MPPSGLSAPEPRDDEEFRQIHREAQVAELIRPDRGPKDELRRSEPESPEEPLQPDRLFSHEGRQAESRIVKRRIRPRVSKRLWLTDEPDDFLDAPQVLISERPPEIVEAILRGDRVPTSPVAMVSIISSEPIVVSNRRR